MNLSFPSLVARHWKMASAIVVALTWWSVSVQPRLSLSNRLTFGLFLVKVYWPEIAFAALLAIFVLVGHATGLFVQWRNAVIHRGAARATWSYLPFGHKFAVVLVVASVLVVSIAVSARHMGRALDYQLSFVFSGELMDWFREDLLRLAAIEARRGNYDGAARITKDLGDELSGSPQADHAQSLARELQYMMKDRQDSLTAIQARFRRVGVSRQDVALQQFYGAMLPEGEAGAELPLDPQDLSPQIAGYLASLRQGHKGCAETGLGALDSRTVGEAFSALGFARNPEWLEPNVDLAARRHKLCAAIGGLSEQDLDALVRQAFSVASPPTPQDWRSALNPVYHRTSRWIVLRSIARSADLPMAKLTGSTSFTHLLGPRPPHDEPSGTKWSDRASVLAVLGFDAGSNDETEDPGDDSDPFKPKPMLDRSGSQDGNLAAVWFQLTPNSSEITICARRLDGQTLDGIKLDPYEKRTPIIRAAARCHRAPPELSREKEWALGIVLANVLSEMDRKGVGMEPGVQRREIRSFICAALVSSASRAAQRVEGLMRLCPREALANVERIVAAPGITPGGNQGSDNLAFELLSKGLPTSENQGEPQR